MKAWKPPIRIEPYPTESLGGFLIRFCDVNAWPSLHHFTKLLGVSVRDVRFQRGDLRKLEARLGLPAGTLPTEGSRLGSFDINLGGQRFNTNHFHKERRVCRTCLAESGYARSYWDLRFISHCHMHRELLDHHCGCGAQLSWQDPSLAQCRSCLIEGMPPALGRGGGSGLPFQEWCLVRLGVSHAVAHVSLLDDVPLAAAVRYVEHVGKLEVGGYAYNRPSEFGLPAFEVREVGFACIRDGRVPNLFARIVREFRAATGIVCPDQAYDALGWFGNALMYEFGGAEGGALKDYLVSSLSEGLGYPVADPNRAGYVSVARLAASQHFTRAAILRALDEMGAASSILEIDGQFVIPEDAIPSIMAALRAS